MQTLNGSHLPSYLMPRARLLKDCLPYMTFFFNYTKYIFCRGYLLL